MVALPGVEVALITPNEYLGCAYSTEAFADLHPSFRVFPVPIRMGKRQGTFNYNAAVLYRALDALLPDILLHDQEVYTLGAAQIARIASIRSIPLAMFVWENTPRDLSWPRRRMARFVMNRCAGLLAGSTGAATVHRDWGFQGPMQVIPQMGVPAIDPEPHFGRRDPGCLQITFAGRLVHEKGVDCLLRAVAILHARKLPMHCTIMGDGPELSKLQQLVRTLDITAHVTMPGSIPLKDVARQLQRSDVLVLPSRKTKVWEEQFGRILVEAMAKATVTLGTKTGAIPEVIGTESLLFDEDDDQALAELLFTLATDTGLLEAHQRALWQRSSDFYLNDCLAKRRTEFLLSLGLLQTLKN
jgi:glycosyltransferase involved in cell wall biosynthesis